MGQLTPGVEWKPDVILYAYIGAFANKKKYTMHIKIRCFDFPVRAPCQINWARPVSVIMTLQTVKLYLVYAQLCYCTPCTRVASSSSRSTFLPIRLAFAELVDVVQLKPSHFRQNGSRQCTSRRKEKEKRRCVGNTEVGGGCKAVFARQADSLD